MSTEFASAFTSIPKDSWGVIFNFLNLYDTIFLRATSKWFRKLCKEFQPFPRFHVLDQNKCMAYLIENGSISCLDYVKNVLHFEWTSEQCSSAARCGQVEVLKHLRLNGCPIHEQTALAACTQGTCSLSMIKYLHQTCQISSSLHLAFANIARQGHIDCLMYAFQNGYSGQIVGYTPTIECLNFMIEYNLNWKGAARGFLVYGQHRPLTICEEAAKRGNLMILKHAHQNGAELYDSSLTAAEEGHLDCLIYAIENSKFINLPTAIKTIECLKYLLGKFRLETIARHFDWKVPAKTNVEYLHFVIDSGIPLPIDDAECESIVDRAADSVETLKFFIDHLPRSVYAWFDVYTLLARRGSIEGLKIAVERNLPYYKHDEASSPVNNRKISDTTSEVIEESCYLKLNNFKEILISAILSKQIEVVNFVWNLFPNKEGFNIEDVLTVAVCHSTPEILQFMTECGAKWTTTHLQKAAEEGNLPSLAYLTRIGCEWNEARCISNYNECIKYAREHGCWKFEQKKKSA